MDVYIVSMKEKEEWDGERFDYENIRVFNSYANAFKFIQIRHPDIYKIYKTHNGPFTNKKQSVFYKIEKFAVHDSVEG